MILRPEGPMVRVIRQPDHARQAGEIGRSWGTGPFLKPSPPLVEAACHHDDGWQLWEPHPLADGSPASFMDLGLGEHLEIWRRSIGLAEARHPYQALMVSRHAVRLYRRYFFQDAHPPEEEALVFRFWEEEEARQAGWVESLAGDPEYAKLVRPERLEVATRLLALWDMLSLLLCQGREGVLERVPCRDGEEEIRVICKAESVFALDPFPFGAPVRLEVPAWRIPPGPYAGREVLSEALKAAPRLDVRHLLVPLQEA